MEAEAYSLEYVDHMIDFLENKIESGAVTSALLGGLQRRLDAIDAAFRDDVQFGQYYSHMLELQTLIYGEGRQEQKALEFMKEAVRQAGGVGRLYSKLIKRYILDKHQPVAAAALAQRAEELGEQQPATRQVAERVTSNRRKLPWPHFHRRQKSRKPKVALAMVGGLIALSAAAFAFLPQTAAVAQVLTRHSAIAGAKENFNRLTIEYNKCSAVLASERSSVDINDSVAVDAYNQATKHCQDVLAQQGQAASRYNSLINAK